MRIPNENGTWIDNFPSPFTIWSLSLTHTSDNTQTTRLTFIQDSFYPTSHTGMVANNILLTTRNKCPGDHHHHHNRKPSTYASTQGLVTEGITWTRGVFMVGSRGRRRSRWSRGRVTTAYHRTKVRRPRSDQAGNSSTSPSRSSGRWDGAAGAQKRRPRSPRSASRRRRRRSRAASRSPTAKYKITENIYSN